MSLMERIHAPRPKKLLALDGGGIRGMITVEILAKIEAELKERLGADDGFVLADYFDYIAGTSTGAIIGACLALGWPVERIRRFYIQSGEQMFDKASLRRRFKEKFNSDNLQELLKGELGREQNGEPITLGSDSIRTLLMMVMRNATTNSPWPVSNNPFAKYNDPARPDSNLRFPLWQLVRASTAAPTYFPPEVIDVGARPFIFVDGGVTPYNNPAFQLFLMATVEPYKLRWKATKDDMLLVSIGTGTSPGENHELTPEDMHLLYNASTVPSALMFAALNEQDFLCRVFGDCRHGELLEREIGDMCGAAGPCEKLFTYVRYNTSLTRQSLDELGLSDVEPEDVQQLDSVKHVESLSNIGRKVAGRDVKIEHFAGFC